MGNLRSSFLYGVRFGRALEEEIVIVDQMRWDFLLVHYSDTRNIWKWPRMPGQVGKQCSCRCEDRGVALVQCSAGVDAKDAGIHDIINALGLQVALLQETEAVSNAMLGVITLL